LCDCTAWEILRRELFFTRRMYQIVLDHEIDIMNAVPGLADEIQEIVPWLTTPPAHLHNEMNTRYYDVSPFYPEEVQAWVRSVDPMREGVREERERHDMLEVARSMIECMRLRQDVEHARMRAEDFDASA